MSLRFYLKDAEISFSFWFFTIVSLFLTINADVIAYCFLLPVAVHELGHLIAMRLCGIKVKAVEFTAFGVGIKKEDNRQSSYIKEIIVSVAGIAANVMCALGLYFFTFKSMRIMLLISVNAAVAAFNALPIGSLDGGSVIKLLSQRFFSPRLAYNISLAFSFLALLPLLSLSAFLILRPERNFTLLAVSVYLAALIIRDDL